MWIAHHVVLLVLQVKKQRSETNLGLARRKKCCQLAQSVRDNLRGYIINKWDGKKVLGVVIVWINPSLYARFA